MISAFIWQKRKPRIKYKLLQDTVERGGAALPDWEIYYQAATLVWIKDWMELKNLRMLTLEGHDLRIGWHSFLWDDKHKIHSYFTNHTIRNSLLLNWLKIKKQHYMKIPNWLSPVEAIRNIRLTEKTLIIRYKDVIDFQNKLKIKSQLEQEIQKEIDWWTYNQLCSKFKEHAKIYGFHKTNIELDKIILESNNKLISKIYKFLLEYKMVEETVKETMIKWAQNIKHEIHLDKWEELWKSNYKITKAISYKENQFKMFFRWHISPTRLAKMNPKNNSICWKCKKNPGTFYHLWWTCPSARKFWLHIKSWLEQIIDKVIDFEPELFLLGIFNKKYPKEVKFLIIHILTAARIAFASKWKQETVPTDKDLIDKILICAEMDKLTKELQEKEETEYYKSWDKVYQWLQSRKSK